MGKCVRWGSWVACRGTQLLSALIRLADQVPGSGPNGLVAKCGDGLSVSL